jgi:uncharacterized protein YlxP (DUF503 family)
VSAYWEHEEYYWRLEQDLAESLVELAEKALAVAVVLETNLVTDREVDNVQTFIAKVEEVRRLEASG